MSYVKFEDVEKVYHMGEVSIEALRDATFEIEKGEICVITESFGRRQNDSAQYTRRYGYSDRGQGVS